MIPGAYFTKGVSPATPKPGTQISTPQSSQNPSPFLSRNQTPFWYIPIWRSPRRSNRRRPVYQWTILQSNLRRYQPRSRPKSRWRFGPGTTAPGCRFRVLSVPSPLQSPTTGMSSAREPRNFTQVSVSQPSLRPLPFLIQVPLALAVEPELGGAPSRSNPRPRGYRRTRICKSVETGVNRAAVPNPVAISIQEPLPLAIEPALGGPVPGPIPG